MPTTIQHTEPASKPQPRAARREDKRKMRRSPLAGVLSLPRPLLVGALALAFGACGLSVYFSTFHVAAQPVVYKTAMSDEDKQWLAGKVQETNGQANALAPEDRKRAEKITSGHATTYFAHFAVNVAPNRNKSESASAEYSRKQAARAETAWRASRAKSP